MGVLKKTCLSFVVALFIVVCGMVLFTIYTQTYLDFLFLQERLFDSLTILNFCVFWLVVYIGIKTEQQRKQDREQFEETLRKIRNNG